MKTFSVYRKSDGLFTGAQVSMNSRFDRERVHMSEHCDVIEGAFDHLQYRVDPKTGEVVDYQPPAPNADHEWNGRTRRWVKKPEVVAREVKSMEARSDIQSSEEQQARAVREALLEILPKSSPARARLAAINEAIEEKRSDL